MPAFRFLGEQGAGLLDSALQTFGSAYHADRATATAALYSLIKNHPFQDGNKRFAIVATQLTLMMNGMVAALSGEQWENLALAVAANVSFRADCEVMFRQSIVVVLGRDGEPTTDSSDWLRSPDVSPAAIKDLADNLRALRYALRETEEGSTSDR